MNPSTTTTENAPGSPGDRAKKQTYTLPRVLDHRVKVTLAESTGKDGKGLIPIDREKLATPERYGNDRLFAYLRLKDSASPEQNQMVDALARAGQPVVRIELATLRKAVEDALA